MAKQQKVCTVTPKEGDSGRIAAYIRVSTEDQAESGLGLEAQRSQVLAMAQVKNWDTPVIYEDAGVTGTKDITTRPKGAELVEAIQAGEVDALIIPALDRVARRAIWILSFADLCREYDVSLVSCKESLDTSTPTGMFVLNIMAAVAQLERDTISSRTKAALAVRGQKDGEKGGKLPYGYIRTLDGIAIDEEAAQIVKRIFALHRRGRTLRDIAAQVSSEKKVWRHSSIAEILKNKDVYKGGRRGASDVRWPAIIR
jgi:site-specific DNA recombinase